MKISLRWLRELCPVTLSDEEIAQKLTAIGLEVLGAGMVNPDVLAGVGYDPERITGYAFGVGIDRLAMLRHHLDDLRTLFENDVRFLEQL